MRHVIQPGHVILRRPSRVGAPLADSSSQHVTYQDALSYGDSALAWAPLLRYGGEGNETGGDDLITFDFDYLAAMAQGYTEFIEITYNTSVFIKVGDPSPYPPLAKHETILNSLRRVSHSHPRPV